MELELPRLRVKKSPFGDSAVEIIDFKQARSFGYGKGALVVVEGQVVNSYEELVRLVEKGYTDRESLDVVIIPLMAVGG